MGVSTKLGIAAASFHAMGTVFYSKFLNAYPLFSFFPKLIGISLIMLSAICWTLEAIFEDMPEGRTSRREHLKARWHEWKSAQTPTMFWGAMAGMLALLASAIFIISHGLASTPLFFVFSGLNFVVAYCWGKSAKNNTWADKSNFLAASCVAVATVFYIAARFLPASLPLKTIGIAFDLITAGLWMMSYGLAKWEAKSELKLPVSTSPIKAPQQSDERTPLFLPYYYGKPKWTLTAADCPLPNTPTRRNALD